jgi:hypothetical protein
MNCEKLANLHFQIYLENKEINLRVGVFKKMQPPSVNSSIIMFKKFQSQILISIGIAISSLSQITLLIFPDKTFNPKLFIDLSNWVSLSSGFGLVTSSIVSSLILNATASRNNIFEKINIRDFIYSLRAIFAFSTIAIVVSGSIIFFENITLLVTATIFSILIQTLGAIQRYTYFGLSNWGAVATQLSLEGIIRIAFIVFFSGYISLGIFGFILLSISAQLLAIYCTTIFYPWYSRFFAFSGEKIQSATQSDAIRIGISVLGGLVISSLSVPLITILNFDLEVIRQLTLLLVIIRIPQSLLWPLLIPIIIGAAKAAKNYNRKPLSKTSVTFAVLVILMIFTGNLSLITLFKLNFFTLNILEMLASISIKELIMVTLVSSLLILESYFVSIYAAAGFFNRIILPYLVSIPVLIISLHGVEKNGIGMVLFSMLMSLVTTNLLLAYPRPKLKNQRF